MQIINKVILGILGVMSLAAGGAKIIRVPEEAQFFADAGLAPAVMIAFGVVQALAGILMLPQKTRVAGSLVAAIMFACSAVMILMSGNLQFGLVALVPVLMAGYVAWQASQAK